MGILLNTAAIFIGGAVGCIFKRFVKITKTMLQALGIAVMFISVINIISNSLIVKDGILQTKYILIIVISLLIGTFIGDAADIDGKLKIAGKGGDKAKLGFITGTMLFGIGGLQITGALSCVINNDNSVLITKCIVDFPLALSFGAMLGMGIALSAFPVGIMQAVIGGAALATRGFFTPDLIAQLNAMGYLILFFIGFNMVFDGTVSVKTNNMLPALAVIVIYNLISCVLRGGI